MKKKRKSGSEEPEIYSVRKDIKGLKIERRNFLRNIGLIAGASAMACKNIKKDIIPGALGEPIPIPKSLKAETCENLNAHSDGVIALSFSDDDKFLVSGGSDKTLKIWSVPDGQLLKTIQDQENTIRSVSVSPESKIIVSAFSDNKIKIWSFPEGELIRNLEGHTGYIYSVCITSDGKIAVSGSEDSTINVWSVPDGQLLNTLKGHTSSVYSLIFSRDGKILVSGSSDSSIKVWSIPDGKIIKTIHLETNSFGSIALNIDNNILAICTGNEIALWSLDNGKKVVTLKGHSDRVTSLCFSPDGKTLASGSRDKTIKLWSVADGKQLITSKGHTEEVNAICYANDGNKIASGGYDKTIKIWDLTSYPGIDPDATYQEGLAGFLLPITESGKNIAFKYDDNKVRVVDLEMNATKYTVKTRRYFNELAITSDARYLLTGNYGGTINWWNLEDKKEKGSFDTDGNTIERIIVKKDGKEIITEDLEGNLKIWSFPEFRCLGIIEIGIGTITSSIGIDRDEKLLAVCYYESSLSYTLKIWSLESFTLLKTFLPPQSSESNRNETDTLPDEPDPNQVYLNGAPSYICFAPKSDKLFIGTDKGMQVYDYINDRFVNQVESEKWIKSASITGDEKYIAIACNGNEIEIRSFPDLRFLKSIDLAGLTIQRLVFLNETHKLIVYLSDSVRIYQITDYPDDLILTSCFYDKDQLAEATEGIQYTAGTATLTLPCGSAIPAGYVCTCNCITIGPTVTYYNTYYYTYYYTYWYPN